MATVLLVENEWVSRRNIARCLGLSGYDVREAESGESALDLLRSESFDLVISDLNLPGGVSGMDILCATQKGGLRVRGILITAYISEEIASRARSVGAICLEKPISMRELEDAMRGLTASRERL